MIIGLSIVAGIGVVLYLLAQANPSSITDSGTINDIQPANVDSQPAPAPVTPTGTIIDPYDRNTWPAGDRLWDVCRAIATAEGYGIPGALPTRCKNPGDMGLGDRGYGTANESDPNNHITVFGSDEDGWNALRRQMELIESGASSVYSPAMTWVQIAQKWAASCRANPGCGWLRTVCNELGVDPGSKFSEYIYG